MAFCAARGCNKCIRQKSRALRKNGGKGEKNDSGQSRVFSIDTRRQIEAYRKQFPHITGRKSMKNWWRKDMIGSRNHEPADQSPAVG